MSHDAYGMERSTVERSSAIDRRRAGVLAVDDHASFLAVLRDVVGGTRRLKVIGQAQSGEGALQAVEELGPDVVLMDVRMPGLGGIEAARRIKAGRPSTLIVLISSTHPDELPREAAEGIADAVIWKNDLQPWVLDEIWLRRGGHAAAG